MFKLKSIELSDFLSYRHALIEFRNGLTLINGFNEKGKDSNGAGKSAILSAICWALFGKTHKGLTEVTRHGTSSAQVSLVITEGSNEYRIERGSRSLAFTLNGNEIARKKLDTQNLIESTFKTNYYVFVRSCLFGQGQIDFLAATTDAEKKKLFKNVLGLEKVDKWYDGVRHKIDALMEETKRLEWTLKHTEDEIGHKKVEISAIEENRQRDSEMKRVHVQGLLARKDSIKPVEPMNEIAKYREVKAALEDVDDLEELSEEADLLSTKARKIASAMDTMKIKGKQLEDTISGKQSLGPICPTCNGEVNPSNIQSVVDHCLEELNRVKSDYMVASETHEELMGKLEALNDKALKIRKLQLEEQKLKLIVMDYRMQEDKYRAVCEAIDSEINSVQNRPQEQWDSVLQACKSTLRDMHDDAEHMRQKLAHNMATIDHLSFLKWTLSKEGFPSYVIENSFAAFKTYANQYLSKLTRESMVLDIVPQKELKTGALKEEIDIAIIVGGRRVNYWGLSDGQRQKVNICLLFALYKLCKERGINPFDFMLLDEVLDLSLADGGCADAIQLIKDMNHEIHTIVVISHKDSIKNDFDHLIDVYRGSDGVSVVR